MEDIFLPVLESSVVLAAHYCKAAGRNTVTSQDMCYGMMYAARYVVGKHIGSLYPEVYDESDTESDNPHTASGSFLCAASRLATSVSGYSVSSST